MNPDLMTIWTPEELAQLAKIMTLKYGASLRDRHFDITAHAATEGVFVTMTLSNESKTYFYPLEGRLAHVKQDLTAQEAVAILVDYMDAYFETFFHDGESTFIPIDWSPFSFEGHEFEMRGQILNLALEQEAESWLKKGE